MQAFLGGKQFFLLLTKTIKQMKKLLTLLTLLLTSVGAATSAWGAATWTVDYSGKAKSWTVTDNQETLVVSDYGTLTLDYNLGGKADVYGNASYVKFSGNGVTLTITLPTGKTFKPGEKIQVTGKGGKSGSPGCVYVVLGENIIKAVDIAQSSQDTFDSGELEIPESFAESSTLVVRRATSAEYQTDGTTACGGTFYIQKVIYTEQAKVISSQTFAGVKVGETSLTADAATNGYSVATNTITLSDDQESISAPTNVKLINHIVYSDDSSKDEEVAVTFDGTVAAGYYVGTATIDETDYTVKVKKVTSPTAELSATSGSIAITNSYTVIGTTTVTLTGGNLTDGTYNVTADADGTTISPATFTVADGSVNQEFTITSSATSAATTVFTFGTSSMGVAAPTYTLTYSKTAQRGLSQANVSATTTWDWTKAGGATIQLAATTIPAKEEGFLLANLAEITNDANFNSQALVGSCEYPNRGGYFQGSKIQFTTTVPGVIDVNFSNTGSKRPYRYLNVNGKNTSFKDNTGKSTSATNINVPTGDVIIQSMFVDDESQYYLNVDDSKYYIKAGNGTDADFALGNTNQYGVAQYIRIYKIVFTANVEAVGTKSEHNYASYVTTNKLDFASAEGITAYIASGLNGAGDAVVLQPVDIVPAGTPVIVKTADPGTTIKVPITTAEASDVTGNLLMAGDGTTAYNGVAGKDIYYLASDEFHIANAGTLQSGKAYLAITSAKARDLTLIIGDDATAISSLMNNEKVNNEVYNLKGQRVSQPTKGLYIVNGKKTIIK